MKWLTAIFAVLIAVGIAEFSVRRTIGSPPLADFILQYPVEAPRFVIDRELGYIPRIGDIQVAQGYCYDFSGVNVDESIRRDHGTKRILFLGDSVTRQGHILRALDAAYKGNQWMFLNAGVEGYNVVQEVDYFFRYPVREEKPDRIVITIHNNDLTYFPMSYMSSPNDFFWYFPGEHPLHFERRLYEKSYLYRHYVTWRYLRLQARVREENRLPGQTREALRRLRDWCTEHKVKLQALVHPILRPLSEWTEEEKSARETELAITRDLGIETFDLVPPMEAALRDGKKIRAGIPSDYWHSNEVGAGYFARYLKEKGLFR